MNAPAHTVLSVQQFLSTNGMNPVPHPPYSPDITLSNFYFFTRIKKVLKGKCLANAEEVKQTDKQKWQKD